MHDVAIIGFGPSGAIATALLGQAGHRVFVCDKVDTIYPKPRAIALDHEILRVFQQLGIADDVAPHTEPFTDSCFFGVDGRLIRRMTMLAPPHPQGWTPSVVFEQPAVEAVLRDAVRRLPNVAVALSAELVSLQSMPDHVELSLSDGRHVDAKYVIGCDGASSRVRSLIGLALEDLGFDEPWLVVDVLANERGLAKLPTTSVQYCEPERPCTYVIGPKNHRRWEISLKPGEDPAQAATPEGTWALLSRWIEPDDADLWRQASYRFHALVAERWRAGRVFIAGDAAHQQPPFLGQGMCQGVRDVANLAWKLAAVLKGQGGDALLDTYGDERRRHVTELTTKLKGIGALICERDAERAKARDDRLIAEAGGSIRPTPRQDVLPRLETGLLAGTDSSARGTLFPQPWLMRDGARVRMDDACGHGWRLLLRDAGDAPADALPSLRTLSLPSLNEAEGVLAAWFDRHRCAAALVRPDHYVFGTAVTADGVPSLLDEAAARLR